MLIDERTFYQWWDIFHAEDKVVELRLLDPCSNRNASGLFQDPYTALQALQGYYKQMQVYSPFNPLHEGLIGRYDVGALREGAKTISDNDVTYRRWVMIDFDPKRPTGINSTDAELAHAKEVMMKVGVFLRDEGFKSPVVAMSGNGYHLMYRIQVENTAQRTELISQFLKVISMNFSDDYCDIDTQVGNAARITKVIGALSVKGANSPERPQRMTKFVRVPSEIEITPAAFLEKVAGQYPEAEKPSRFNGYSSKFDLDAFIAQHGIEISKVVTTREYTKYILARCPFNPAHEAPDAAIFKIHATNAIGFKCLHNSCSSYTWRDVRLHYDPNAYERQYVEEYKRKREYYSNEEKPAPVITEEIEELGKKWMSLKDIEWIDPNSLTYIPSGIRVLDEKMYGLALDDVTILSGRAGAGKSSVLNFIILNAICRGFKAAVWSGELSGNRFKRWFNAAAAGGGYMRKGEKGYFLPEPASKRVDQWTEGKVFLYNNEYGSKISQLISDITECIKVNGTQLICLDNRMAIDLDSYSGDQNEREAQLLNALRFLAMKAHIHIILVCHPRKDAMNSLLRMESIAGSATQYNAAANVLLIHRVGNDFERRARDFFMKSTVDDILLKQYSTMIEIAKSREAGAVDDLVGLFFDEAAKRFLNEPTETLHFGWDEEGIRKEKEETKVSEWTSKEYQQFYERAQQDEEDRF